MAVGRGGKIIRTRPFSPADEPNLFGYVNNRGRTTVLFFLGDQVLPGQAICTCLCCVTQSRR